MFLLSAADVRAQAVAFAGGTLIDGTERPPVANSLVVVSDSLIICAGTRAACTAHLGTGTRVVDLTGRWIIPGLIDVHVHLTMPQLTDSVNERWMALLRAGVTTVRDVGAWADPSDSATTYAIGHGQVERMAAMASAAARAQPRGPRIHYCGPAISEREDAPRPAEVNNNIRLGTRISVTDAVGYLASRGAACIKLFSGQSGAHMRSVLEAAAARGVPGIGHSSASVPLDEQLAWPWREIHHMYIPVGDLLPAAQRAGLPDNPFVRAAVSVPRFDPVAAEAAVLAMQAAARGIAWAPTLTVTRGGCDATCWQILRSAAPADSAFIRASLFESGITPLTLQDSINATRPAQLRFVNAWVSLLHRTGVTILAGSDAPAGGPLGTALHDELEHLVAAGLSPAAALAAATRNAAVALGVFDRVGTIEAGKLADLVVLNADPLAEVRNIRTISLVVLGGAILAH